jgi:TonB family protein
MLQPTPVLGRTGAPAVSEKPALVPEPAPPERAELTEPAAPPVQAASVPADTPAPENKRPTEVPRPESLIKPADPPPPPEQPRDVAAKQAEPKQEQPPKPAPPKPAAARKPDRPRPEARVSREAAVAAALKDISKQANRGGGGGEGAGAGGGLADLYRGEVIQAIQPFWSMPMFTRQNMVVRVRIRIDLQGKVLDCDVAESSGNQLYDTSTLNAVKRAGTLPPPPNREWQNMVIAFNSQEMGR